MARCAWESSEPPVTTYWSPSSMPQAPLSSESQQSLALSSESYLAPTESHSVSVCDLYWHMVEAYIQQNLVLYLPDLVAQFPAGPGAGAVSGDDLSGVLALGAASSQQHDLTRGQGPAQTPAPLLHCGQGQQGHGGAPIKASAAGGPRSAPPLSPADQVTAHRVSLPTILHVPKVTGSARHRVK